MSDYNAKKIKWKKKKNSIKNPWFKKETNRQNEKI